MVKKRRNPGAEGTGCRPGDHFCDRERSRAWEVDLVVWCWLICHCAYVPGPGRPGLCLSFFSARAVLFRWRRKARQSIGLAEGDLPLF